MTIRDSIAERLRLAREQAGLSLRDVAAEVDLSYATIHNYERGKHPMPVEALLRLAAVYDRDVMWFLHGG